MDKEELLALADRCEAATGADRELDLAVYRTHFDGPDRFGTTARGKVQGIVPRYTASIDAALTLVPYGMRDEIEITTLYQVARVGINLNHGPDDGPHYGSNECNSIPLAICAAALRALAND